MLLYCVCKIRFEWIWLHRTGVFHLFSLFPRLLFLSVNRRIFTLRGHWVDCHQGLDHLILYLRRYNPSSNLHFYIIISITGVNIKRMLIGVFFYDFMIAINQKSRFYGTSGKLSSLPCFTNESNGLMLTFNIEKKAFPSLIARPISESIYI